jgi:hypothetical protein
MVKVVGETYLFTERQNEATRQRFTKNKLKETAIYFRLIGPSSGVQ